MTWNGADVDLVARLERDQRVVVELVLLDLVAEQAAGQGRGVDRHARELGQDVRQRADVVLVGVGDEERLDVGAALLEVGDVGDDEVDAEHLLVGEHQAAVDDDDLVAVLEHVHVLADLPHPAERDDAERLVVGRGGIGVLGIGQKRVSWGVGVVGGRGGAAARRDRARRRWLGRRRAAAAGGASAMRCRAGRRSRPDAIAGAAPRDAPRVEQGGRDRGDVGVALALDGRRPERGGRVVHREHERRSRRRSPDRPAGPCRGPARSARPA